MPLLLAPVDTLPHTKHPFHSTTQPLGTAVPRQTHSSAATMTEGVLLHGAVLYTAQEKRAGFISISRPAKTRVLLASSHHPKGPQLQPSKRSRTPFAYQGLSCQQDTWNHSMAFAECLWCGSAPTPLEQAGTQASAQISRAHYPNASVATYLSRSLSNKN